MQETPSHILRPPANVLIPWWYLIPLYAIILIGILALYPSVSPLVIVAGLVILVVTAYYPEIPLVAFVFIGVTKPWVDENIALFETIDYTIFLAGYLGLLLFITMIRRGNDTLPPFYHLLPLLFIFSILLFIGLIQSTALPYGFQKASRFFIFNILLFIATIVIIKDTKDITRTLAITIGFSFVFATIMFYEGFQSLMSGDLHGLIVRMTILGANPIPSARIFSLTFLILLVAAYYTNRRRNKIIFYLLSGYFLIALIVTNTRGPLISTITAVLIFVLFLSEMKFRAIAIYFCLFIAAILVAFMFLPDFVTSRYEALAEVGSVQGGEINTVSSRLLMWSMAFSAAVESVPKFLFGHGTGSFASLFHFTDIRWYPHNIFAEIVYELGAIGLIVFLLHIGQISRYAHVIWNDAKKRVDLRLITAIILVMTIGAFTASLVSGDLTDNRYLWFHFGLIVASWRIFTIK
jgi:hypothetical protein